MSESEDDFMSDKFLVDTNKNPLSDSYSTRRSAQQLKSLRAGQAKQLPSLKQREIEQRRAGLATSLFDSDHAEGSNGAGTASGGGGGGGGGGGKGKAMEMMMKMGWKIGESLGRRRSPSPPTQSSKRPKADDGVKDEEEEDEAPRGGLGSSSRAKPIPRTEPIRISMWAGRKGLSARSPSPPPLPIGGRNPDALDPGKMKRLDGETENFRERQRKEFAGKEVERKELKAMGILVDFDMEKGVKVSLRKRNSEPCLEIRSSGGFGTAC